MFVSVFIRPENSKPTGTPWTYSKESSTGVGLRPISYRDQSGSIPGAKREHMRVREESYIQSFILLTHRPGRPCFRLIPPAPGRRHRRPDLPTHTHSCGSERERALPLEPCEAAHRDRLRHRVRVYDLPHNVTKVLVFRAPRGICYRNDSAESSNDAIYSRR